jgi:hypothetical protein
VSPQERRSVNLLGFAGSHEKHIRDLFDSEFLSGFADNEFISLSFKASRYRRTLATH